MTPGTPSPTTALPAAPAVNGAVFATGVLVAAAAALWWLASTRLALGADADTARVADQGTQALWLARALLLAVLAPRLGAWLSWRAAAATGLVLLAPAWPLGVLMVSAGSAAITPTLRAEGLLLVAAVVLPGLGQGLRRLPGSGPYADAAATLLGIALASGLWHGRHLVF
jgi:hypothetical protein